jgi:hypothetical protein
MNRCAFGIQRSHEPGDNSRRGRSVPRSRLLPRSACRDQRLLQLGGQLRAPGRGGAGPLVPGPRWWPAWPAGAPGRVSPTRSRPPRSWRGLAPHASCGPLDPSPRGGRGGAEPLAPGPRWLAATRAESPFGRRHLTRHGRTCRASLSPPLRPPFPSYDIRGRPPAQRVAGLLDDTI